MKKFFLFAAALLVAASMNLQAAGDASVSVKRALVGSELKALKASYTNTAITSQYAIGASATYKNGSAATVATDLYVNGAKVSGDHVIYPGTEQAALTEGEWFGMQINVAAGASFTITDIIAQLAPGNSYKWDVKVRNASGTELYFSNAAFQVQGYNNAGNHAEDSIHFAVDTITSNAKTHASYQSALDKAARIPAGLTLTEGTYTVEIYYWGKASKALSLVELTVLGQAEGGEAYVAPTPVLPTSLQNIVDSAKAIVDEPMYSQYKGNLSYALDIAKTTIDYEANEAALRAAYAVAAASVEAYKLLIAEIAVAQAQIDAASAEDAGYTTFQNAIASAQSVCDKGSAKDPAANVTSLVVAENAFIAAAGTADAPADVTAFFKDIEFAADTTYWKISGNNMANITYETKSGDYGFTGSYIEATSAKKFQNYTISQTITNIPNGDYKFSAKVYYIEEANYGKGTLKLYANDKSATCSKSSADGGTVTSVFVRVSDNTLTVKMTETDNRNTIVAFGDVKLEYYNFRSWARINADSTMASISCKEEFEDALLFDGWKEGGDVILSFASGTYDLGANVSRNFPSNKGNLYIKAANGATPIFNGSIRPNDLVLQNLIIEGITFNIENTSTDNSPLHLQKGKVDSIYNEIVIRNCTFNNLPACMIRLNANNDTEKYIHSIVIENNKIDGINHHFFQFAGGKSFGLANFTFRENIVMNMAATGGQFFNTPLSVKHPANDSIYTMTVEHNAFYKIGGMATQARNFWEGNKDNNWAEVYINFNNNIFWDRYSWDGYSESNLALFNATESQKVEVNFLNNLLSEVNVYANDALDEPMDMVSFPVSSGNITPVYNHIIADTTVFKYTPSMKILKSNSLYTAGTNGTYVGPIANYYGFDVDTTGCNYTVENLAQFEEALSYAYKNPTEDITFEFKNNTDDCGYFALGMTARNFPQNFCNLTFKAAKDAKPQISGSFRSSNGMKVNNLTIDGLYFVKGNMTSTDASPLFFHKGIKDTVMNEVAIRNCNFKDVPACIVRINANNDTEKYIHSMVIENNVIDSIPHHLFQFAGKSNGMANFTFRENMVSNMYATGGQFFNTHISPKHPANDSIYNFTVEHNVFYKIGGSATSARKFIECTDANNWSEAYFNINNNIFWDRYSWEGYAESNVSMFNADSTQKVEVNFLNNILSEVNVFANDAADEPLDMQSFLVDAGNIVPTYANILAEDINFTYTPGMPAIWSIEPIYTAGTNGTYIGAQKLYKVVGFELASDGVIVKNVAEFTDALVYADKCDLEDYTIYMKNSEDEGGIYNLGDKKAYTYPQTKKSLTITAAEGAQPVLAGSFRSSNGMVLEDFTVENLNFKYSGKWSTDASPLYFHKGIKDTISNQLTVRNCTFTNIPACIIRINANGAEKYISKVLVENNVIDTINHHLFQFAGKNIGMASFTFRENIVKNMTATGGQFFNTHISPNHPANDSIYNFTVEHNTFYKIGGAATQARKFIECGDNNDWSEAYFNINNNIFWDRYSWDGYAESDVQLFEAKEGQKVELNFLNNVVAPENAFADDALDAPMDMQSFPVIAGNIVPTYANIIVDTLDTEFWADQAALTIYKGSRYYTAGTDSSYIGALVCYINDPIIPVFPENAIYAWESPEGKVFELGGTAAHYSNDVLVTEGSRANYANDKYFSLCLNGKADYAEHIQIELDSTLAAGDTIFVTAYRNKNADSKKANAKFKIGSAEFTDGTDGLFYTNICADDANADYDNDGNEPNSVAVAVPEAAYGEKSISITRGQTGTNLFITRLVITRTPQIIESIKSVEREATGVMYDIYGRKVNETVKGQIYIMDGQKFIEK